MVEAGLRLVNAIHSLMTSDCLPHQMVEAGPRLVNAIHTSSRALQHVMLGTARAVALSCSVLSYGAHKLQAAQARRAERQPPPQPRQPILPQLVDEERHQPNGHAASEGAPITAPAAVELIRASSEEDGGASAAPATAPVSPGRLQASCGGGGSGGKGAQIRQGLERTRVYLQHVALVSDCIGRSVLHGGKHVLR